MNRLRTYCTSLLMASMLLLITAALNSCGNGDDQVKYRIGVSQCSDDAWRTKFNEEVRRELLLHPGIEVEIRSANDNNENQARDIEYFIDKKVDLLIVAPNEADFLEPYVSKAFDTGMPVIVCDRRVKGNKFTAAISGDNLECGHMMGRYLKMHMPEGGKVIELFGLRSSTPTILRHKGLMEYLDKDSVNYQFLRCTGNWFREEGKTETRKILLEHPDVKCIIAQNDQMAIGASQAVKEMQLSNKIHIMGVDGLTGPGNGVEAIEQGVIDASVEYATGGDIVLQTALKILKGEPYERDRYLATYMIDAESAPLINSIYKEVDHEVETIHELKGQVDRYWEQHNLEQTLLGTLLAIVALVCVVLVILIRMYNMKHKATIRLEEQQKQLQERNHELVDLTVKLQEATHAKLNFFTNVSHDFRTPLTLIADPIKQLVEAKNLTESQQQLMNLANKNVHVLLRLVNQILDFRRYESNKLELNLQNVNLSDRIRNWYDSFQSIARKQSIVTTLRFLDETGAETDDPLETQVDLSKIERIFFNLMGNAFKYIPMRSHINVTCQICKNELNTISEKVVKLYIEDDGPGISVDHIQHIFENFYQVDTHHEGSGIGLALVRAFAELHGGSVECKNVAIETGDKNQHGSIFIITLPLRPADVTPREELSYTPQTFTDFEPVAEIEQDVTEEEPKPVALVIDDNADIRAYLKTLLGNEYRVLTAPNGEEGIRRAMRTVPDVILCDVMMPGIDGLETCRKLKSEVNTSHIPVLMLTACNLDEERIKGLKDGADAYISKPFNSEVLMAQIESLIANHNRVKDFFENLGGTTATTNKDKKPEDIHLTLEDKFIQKVKVLIAEHLNDSDFGVDQMAEKIGMSRAQLYRKVKAITGFTPLDLIRNTRLRQAQQMLAKGDKTVAQVAYSVGFTAPSYFTKCYKEYFGETPTELTKQDK